MWCNLLWCLSAHFRAAYNSNWQHPISVINQVLSPYSRYVLAPTTPIQAQSTVRLDTKSHFQTPVNTVCQVLINSRAPYYSTTPMCYPQSTQYKPLPLPNPRTGNQSPSFLLIYPPTLSNPPLTPSATSGFLNFPYRRSLSPPTVFLIPASKVSASSSRRASSASMSSVAVSRVGRMVRRVWWRGWAGLVDESWWVLVFYS